MESLVIKNLKNFKYSDINIPMDFNGRYALSVQIDLTRNENGNVTSEKKFVCLYDCDEDSAILKEFD